MTLGCGQYSMDIGKGHSGSFPRNHGAAGLRLGGAGTRLSRGTAGRLFFVLGGHSHRRLYFTIVVSDSVRPCRRKPTRLPHPWDSPGKNTGVSCHFLLQCMKVISESEVAQSCLTLSDPMDCSLPGSSVHGIFQARVLEWGAISFSNLAGYI